MSQRTLQIVATGLVLVAVTAFGMGVWNAPSRGRMPGERAAGAQAGAGALVNATEAVPLSGDRIEGLAPRELTEEEKEKLQAAREAKEEADAAAKASGETAVPPGAAPAAGPVPVEAPPAPPPDEAPH
jgi:hypothetical protein